MVNITSVDTYISQFSEEKQQRLQKLREIIKLICPNAEEKISWGMPTYVYAGFNLVHFAQHTKHIGFYPADTGVKYFQPRLASYTCTKGSIHFRDQDELPETLIQDIVTFRMSENEQYAFEKEQKKWTVTRVLKELKTYGNERTKRSLKRYGVNEPYDGVAVKDLKELMKKTGKQHGLAMSLYKTGHYDAMYFAGMIAEPDQMSKEDFKDWMNLAYCYGISDYIVAVTLAETSFAQELAGQWIKHSEERYQSAGWSCYIWLLGVTDDDKFSLEQIQRYMNTIEGMYYEQSDHLQVVMRDFIVAVAISYKMLHQEAYALVKRFASIEDNRQGKDYMMKAQQQIEKAIEKQRIGFKRKGVRC